MLLSVDAELNMLVLGIAVKKEALVSTSFPGAGTSI
jgi:hypothetical protein